MLYLNVYAFLLKKSALPGRFFALFRMVLGVPNVGRCSWVGGWLLNEQQAIGRLMHTDSLS